MDIAVVRKRVADTIDRARRDARDRRTRADDAAREFATFLDRIAIPVCRQVANVLKSSSYDFVVHTPGGAVRLASERSADDYIELTLDTESDDFWVLGHSRRTRGRRVVDAERPIRRCPVRDITEEDVLAFVLGELAPFVER